MTLRRIATGAIAAASIALAAKRAKSLDSSGALAATAVGTCVYSGLGICGTVVMLGFFLPSSLLSRYAKRKRGVQTLVDKDGSRDAGQVLANGGIAALCALFGHHAAGRLAFTAALAAASSDTWSTEIGTVFGGRPYGLVTGKQDDNGLSGNVSDIGFGGALVGAIWIAALAGLCDLAKPQIIAAAGVGGCLMDSLLGATLQARYRCTVCGTSCELRDHCHQVTEKTRGFQFMNNDSVNALATCSAVLIAVIAQPWKRDHPNVGRKFNRFKLF